MFQQHERIADALLIAGIDQRFLQLETFSVGNAAELEEIEDHRCAVRSHICISRCD
jgi:hypothetical protein